MEANRRWALFLAVFLVLGMIISCDIGTVSNNNTTKTPETGLITHKYTSVSNGVTYILEIFQRTVAATARATERPEFYNPAAGDTYKLTIIYANGSTVTNSGTIAGSSKTTTSATFTLSNGENLKVTITKEGNLTIITGTITPDPVRAPGTGQEPLTAPGAVTPRTAGTPPVVSNDTDGGNGDSGGGGGGGSNSDGSGGGGAEVGGGGGDDSDAASTVTVTGVTLNKNTLALTVGGNETLTATIAPSNATNKAVTWSTSNAAIATVSNGTVTAGAAGTANITVTTQDGGKTATCAVTVSASTTSGTGQFNITFAQIADAAFPEIQSEITIYRTITKTPTSATFTLTNPTQYTSITWYINGTTVTGNPLTVNSMNYSYYSVGEHYVTLEVLKDGRRYSKRVTFKIAN